MSSKVPYDLFLAKIKEVAEPTYDVTEWDSLLDNLEQRTDTFLCVEDAAGEDRVISVGAPSANHMEETGEYIVHMFVPSRTGLSIARDLAQIIRPQIRFQVLSPQVLLQAVSPPATGLISEGLWSSMEISVEYRYQYVAPTYVA